MPLSQLMCSFPAHMLLTERVCHSITLCAPLLAYVSISQLMCPSPSLYSPLQACVSLSQLLPLCIPPPLDPPCSEVYQFRKISMRKSDNYNCYFLCFVYSYMCFMYMLINVHNIISCRAFAAVAWHYGYSSSIVMYVIKSILN